MIEQALHVLTLHILWKGKGLGIEKELSPEQVKYREVLKEQRESLLEKLTEYAVGTQSNTVEGVKRAVRESLNLHHFSAYRFHLGVQASSRYSCSLRSM